ncbi:hypothetical protein [Marinomonas epiphytica]
MSLIALLNLAKQYATQRKTNQTFKHLNAHYLQDLGFYRDQNGHIRPLSRAQKEVPMKQQLADSPPLKKGRCG